MSGEAVVDDLYRPDDGHCKGFKDAAYEQVPASSISDARLGLEELGVLGSGEACWVPRCYGALTRQERRRRLHAAQSEGARWETGGVRVRVRVRVREAKRGGMCVRVTEASTARERERECVSDRHVCVCARAPQVVNNAWEQNKQEIEDLDLKVSPSLPSPPFPLAPPSSLHIQWMPGAWVRWTVCW
eukprot:1178760-Rhodomonas_salina.2